MYIGAMDVGGTKTIVAVLNEKGDILCKENFHTLTASFEQHAELCAATLEKLLVQLGVTADDLEGVGINMPGMVDPKRSFLLQAPFAGWKNIYVADYFKKRLGIDHILVSNDTRSCALAEKQFANAPEHYIWMTISTGIGGTMVYEGQLIYGSTFCAGELGHIKVENKHPDKCTCGQQGCLEAQASGTAITKMFRQAITYSPQIGLALIEQGLPDDAYGCAMLAKQGDKTCIAIYDRAGDYIGKALSYAVTLFNPTHVYIGGGVSRDLELLLPSIKNRLDADVIPQCRSVEILQTKLGYEAALLGAAALILCKK